MLDLGSAVVDARRYGWKAHYLSLLLENGYAVPDGFALAPDDVLDIDRLDPDHTYAIRSSGLSEDSAACSYAGHFTTLLSVRGLENVRSAVEDVRASGASEMPMGVVIQRMVEKPVVAGAAFSCHPVTLERGLAVVSWTYGLGDALVGGTAAGNDIEIRLVDGSVISGSWPLDADSLRRIADGVADLENLVGQPVDTEWCIDESGDLFMLQLRPIVLPEPQVSDLDTTAAFDALPGIIASHSKLALRADAVRLDIPMAPARAVLATGGRRMPTLAPFPISDRAAGRSVVLLHPAKIKGKVVREFAKDCPTDVEFFLRGCQRYAIRQYPSQSDAAHAVAHTLQLGLEHSSLACVIEQEILHAYATGILRLTAEGILIEAALGHFVPKGYVETSSFTLAGDLRVTRKNVVPQSKAYHFINGHVVVETPPYESLELTDDDLRRLGEAMRPILDRRPSVALEFGLLGQPGILQPYMIDVADSDVGAEALSAADLARGVVSPGSASGRVVDLRESSSNDDLNAHLYDSFLDGVDPALEPAIYIARHASLDLLPLVRSCHPASGFVFERASLLAHLSVILRERGLAAVTLPASSVDELIGGAQSLTINTGHTPAVLGEGAH